LYCGCFNLFCNVCVGECMWGVLTIVLVFWCYVYLYLLRLVLFVLCFVLFRLRIFILICFICTSLRTTATE